MNRKKLNQIGITLLTIGGTLLAIMGAETRLKRVLPHLPDWFFDVCLLLGVPLCVIGLLLLVLPIETVRQAWWWLFGKKDFLPRRANRDDLPDIHDFGCEEFGEVSPLKNMQDWFRINKEIFHVVHSVRKGKLVRYERLVGYYSIIPLKAAAIPFLEDDNFDGTRITTNLIVREKKGKRLEQPACIYIGGIAARGSKYAQGVVMGGLFRHVMLETKGGMTEVYSRPVTEKGLELLKKYNFEPVKTPCPEPLKHIFKYNLPSDDDDDEIVPSPS